MPNIFFKTLIIKRISANFITQYNLNFVYLKPEIKPFFGLTPAE